MFPSPLPLFQGLNKVPRGIKLPVGNYSPCFKIECSTVCFEAGGWERYSWKIEGLGSRLAFTHSNNFLLKFLDPNKGKQHHLVILQPFREGKRKKIRRGRESGGQKRREGEREGEGERQRQRRNLWKLVDRETENLALR